MNSLFGTKRTKQALAEVLEDGGAIFSHEMEKRNRVGYREYRGSGPMLEIAVRVQPADESPYEAHMKVNISIMNFLKLGVRVQVKYEPAKKEQVTLDDEIQAILKRNPQIIKGRGGLPS